MLSPSLWEGRPRGGREGCFAGEEGCFAGEEGCFADDEGFYLQAASVIFRRDRESSVSVRSLFSTPQLTWFRR